ncbi:class C sortase [Bifidobacterium favimelis]|uniref:Class C sortase n=1 Tax=Bifidobacterium favimelis TaxID=3122979 RepID=A0ABU8ZPG6_9BIFI
MPRSDSTAVSKTAEDSDGFEAIIGSGSSGSGGAAQRLKIISIVILLLGLCTIAFPFALQYKTALEQADQVGKSAGRVAGWPYPQAKEALEAARDYNRHLAVSGQPVMGEAVDPFTAKSQRTEGSAAAADREYQSALDQGDGIMGSIEIPRISVNLPIYHGTSEAALASGAGHLYGTSLPVGGPSTHSVITGHRGMVDALMFTRLDELEPGDVFYIRTMGETLGYKVDRIDVIRPDDTSKLKIMAGQDRVTLMTCTPYGVNTRRLLISGFRAPMPEPVPYPQDAKKDTRSVMAVTIFLTLVALLLTAMRRPRLAVMRHSSGKRV